MPALLSKFQKQDDASLFLFVTFWSISDQMTLFHLDLFSELLNSILKRWLLVTKTFAVSATLEQTVNILFFTSFHV